MKSIQAYWQCLFLNIIAQIACVLICVKTSFCCNNNLGIDLPKKGTRQSFSADVGLTFDTKLIDRGFGWSIYTSRSCHDWFWFNRCAVCICAKYVTVRGRHFDFCHISSISDYWDWIFVAMEKWDLIYINVINVYICYYMALYRIWKFNM